MEMNLKNDPIRFDLIDDDNKYYDINVQNYNEENNSDSKSSDDLLLTLNEEDLPENELDKIIQIKKEELSKKIKSQTFEEKLIQDQINTINNGPKLDYNSLMSEKIFNETMEKLDEIKQNENIKKSIDPEKNTFVKKMLLMGYSLEQSQCMALICMSWLYLSVLYPNMNINNNNNSKNNDHNNNNNNNHDNENNNKN